MYYFCGNSIYKGRSKEIDFLVAVAWPFLVFLAIRKLKQVSMIYHLD